MLAALNFDPTSVYSNASVTLNASVYLASARVKLNVSIYSTAICVPETSKFGANSMQFWQNDTR